LRPQDITTGTFLFACFNLMLAGAAMWICMIAIGATLWGTKLVVPAAKFAFPSWALITGFSIFNRIRLHSGCKSTAGLGTTVGSVVSLVGMYLICRRYQQYTEQRGLALMLWGAMTLCVVFFYIYDRVVWLYVLESGDFTKLIIGAFISPTIYEVRHGQMVRSAIGWDAMCCEDATG
jgi:hypothetical protein